FLMDDSNSYWWLVRVLKTQEVGYIPAENIETPFERLARLNKHRNVDLASATQSELQSDLNVSASRLRTTLAAGGQSTNSSSPLPPPNAPRTGNTVPNPLSQRRGLAFSPGLSVHRYPPAVWNEEEWLIEREERRATIISKRGGDPDADYTDYDDLDFDDEEDEAEWEVGAYEAEDCELADEMTMMRRMTEQAMARDAQQAKDAVPAPQSQKIMPPMEPDDGMQWEDGAAAAQQAAAAAPPPHSRPSGSLRDTKSHSDTLYRTGRERTRAGGGSSQTRKTASSTCTGQDEYSVQEPVSSPNPVKSPTTPTSGGKLRKEREPAADEEKDGKKKKSGGVFGSLFGRKGDKKDKGKNASIGSDSEFAANTRGSEESGRRPSNGSSAPADGMISPTTATAMQQQQQQQATSLRNSTDPKRIQQMQAQQKEQSTTMSAASQLRQRDQQQQALYQQYLNRSPSSPPEAQPSYGLQSAAPYMNSSSTPPSAFHSPPSGGRQRPGSLILTPSSSGDGVGVPDLRVPDLSVIRVFAGQNLDTEATFKTVLLNASTTSADLARRYGPHEYFLTVKQVEGSSAVLRDSEHPLVVFEGLVENAPRVKRSSLDMNDFTDDSAVKFYLNRRGGEEGADTSMDGADDTLIAETVDGEIDPQSPGRGQFLTVSTQGGNNVQPERFTSPSFRFPLQLAIFPGDLPDDMVFDPLTEAIVFKDTLKERGRPSVTSPGISQTIRRKVFVFPKNATVAEVIELGLERFGIEEGVVDGGDEVEDKLSKRRSAVRVRYQLTIDTGNGQERELCPSSRVVDAFPRPPSYRNPQSQFPIQAACQSRRSDVHSPSCNSCSSPCLAWTGRTGTGEAKTPAIENSSCGPTSGLSRQEIIAAQREATRANQRAILSASTNSVRGMDVLLPGNAMIRSARYNADEKMRYSYVQPDGESYDISDIVEEEWRDSDDKTDVLEGVLGRNKDRVGEKLDRVLSKIQSGGRQQQAAVPTPASVRSNSPESQYSLDDAARLVSRTPIPANMASEKTQQSVIGRASPSVRPGTSTPTGAKSGQTPSPLHPGLVSRRQESVTSVMSDDVSGYATPMAPSSPESPMRTPTPKAQQNFGVAHMMTVIELRGSVPRKPLSSLDPVDELLFGRPIDLPSLHPKIREVYADSVRQMNDVDKMLDDYFLNIKG
ncbi:heat shock protein, partial [Favolaschia claudopus]